MSQNIDKLKRTQIKPYTLDKRYRVYVDNFLVMSYDDVELARQCARIIKGYVHHRNHRNPFHTP